MKQIAKLASTLCLVAIASAARGEAPCSAGPKPNVSASGTATLTIDVNGHKETRTIDLGEFPPVVNAADSAEKKQPAIRLGVAIEPVPEDVSTALPVDKGVGLVVRHVVPDSAAAKAGILESDVLTQIGDQLLIHPKQLQTLIANKKPGDKVEVTFFRKGEKKTVSATLETGEADGAATGGLGFKIEDLLKNGIPGGTFQSKAIIIGPDGKQTVIDGNNDAGDIKNLGEQIKGITKLFESKDGDQKPATDAETATQAKVLSEVLKAFLGAKNLAPGTSPSASAGNDAKLEEQKKAIEQMKKQLEELSKRLK